MEKLCLGCMRMKQNAPICELCGFDERTENHPHQLPIGTILQNKYLVGKVLGQGGFGITYIGWDQHLSIPVAIKEYYPGGVVQRNTRWSTDVMCASGEAPELFEKHKNRFLKEARTLAQLSGIPEIVQIKSFFPENGTAYIVMEYVEGITLKEHLKRLGRPMTESEALAIMEPVLKALQKVHDHGLIHRDISPDNIMLPTGGGVKLIDFGTVRYMDDSGKSKSTEAVLKPGFAPMEQYNTRGNLGTWTDVYAICATYHYLLTGKVPADVHDRMDEGESLALLRCKPNVSKKLISALERGMKIRAQERLQTIGELYQQLYSAEKSVPEKKHTKGKYAKQPEKSKASPKKRKGGLLAACAVAAIAVSAAAMLLIPREQKAQLQQSVPETSAAPTQSTTVTGNALHADNDASRSSTTGTEAATDLEPNTPIYYWNDSKYLSFPTAEIQIDIHMLDYIEGAIPSYGMAILCDTMTSQELMTFLIHSTDDWGFDHLSFAKQIRMVLETCDDIWSSDTVMYYSMSEDGIEWTVSLGDDDHTVGIIGLTTNNRDALEVVLGITPEVKQHEDHSSE